jgi:hypothetical protein
MAHKMPSATVYDSPNIRGKTMVKTYRDVAIEQMIGTVEEAMSHRQLAIETMPPLLLPHKGRS